MKKTLKLLPLVLLLLLLFQQAALAEKFIYPPKPAAGIEASNPNFGTSREIPSKQMQSSDLGLIQEWDCTIYNTGSVLSLTGNTDTFVFCDVVITNIFLERWDGSSWVNVKSWSQQEYDAVNCMVDGISEFTPGNYYRARGVHYAKVGSETETLHSTTSYIYCE